MGRFSPTVAPRPGGGLRDLASALQSGVQGYQGQVDRQRAEEDRSLKNAMSQDANLRANQQHAVELDQADYGFGDGSAPPSLSQALETAPMATPAPSPSGVPSAWNPVTRSFEQKSPLESKGLPFGLTRNPAMPNQRARLSLVGDVQNQTAAQGRQMQTTERLAAAESLPGVPAGARPALGQSQSVFDSYAARREPREPLVLVDADNSPATPPVYVPRSQAAGLVAGRVATPGSAGGLGGVRQAAVGALYDTAQYGYDQLERVLWGDDPATPAVERAQTQKLAPDWTAKTASRLGLDIGNVLTTAEYRQVRASAQILGDSWLRFTSGAAVPETEVERFTQAFIPMPGDDAGTAAIKSGGRRVLVAALKRAANRGSDVPDGTDEQEAMALLQQIGTFDPEAAAIGIRALTGGRVNRAGGAPQRGPGARSGLPNNPDHY